MRTAVLSDVHANLEALDAVLDAIDAEHIIVLGDLVGYNADPAAVLQRLREAGATLLAGNHDLAATGRFDVRWFNDVAAAAITWTRQTLDEDVLGFLRALEPSAHDGQTMLVHGSVRDPAAEYLRSAAHAAASFDAEPFTLGFFGHTHLPVAYVRGADGVDEVIVGDGSTLALEPGRRYLLNPGSVGQPRDGDPRAGYLLVDGDTAGWHRIDYDIATAQRKVRDAGLPEVLADRLASGR